jgi:hypothetical protein
MNMILVSLNHRGEPNIYNLGQVFSVSKYTNPFPPKDPKFEAHRTFNAILDFGSEESCYHVDETPEQIMALINAKFGVPAVVDPFAPDTKEVVKGIRENFQRYLAAKTGWGRNEVLRAFNDSVPDFLK